LALPEIFYATPKHKTPFVLTKRQKQLLILFGKDYSYKMAARNLGISKHSVNGHVANMREHFKQHTATGLLGYAFKTGQILPNELWVCIAAC
jgi:DNA-binding CsgD family transcriptional regulator